MTTTEIVVLVTEIVIIILIEVQIFMIKMDLIKEGIMRKNFQRITIRHFRELWEDIRAAGIPRFKPEETENDGK